MQRPPHVLVTGAGRGIGRSIALRFAAAGATVVVAARTEAQIQAVAEEADAAGGRGVTAAMDLTDPRSIETALARALERTDGVLDVLVNNAGAFAIRPFRETTLELWQHMLAVNLTAPFLVTRYALPALERSDRAHLFNIASVAALEAFEGDAAYCASKFGLRGLSMVLRLELEPRVRVTTVYPRNTDTPLWDEIPGAWDRSGWDRPEDVAALLWKAWEAPREEDVSELRMG